MFTAGRLEPSYSEKTWIHAERTTQTKQDWPIMQGSIYAIPEEDTIYADHERIVFVGNRPYYEFRDGTVTERKTGTGVTIHI